MKGSARVITCLDCGMRVTRGTRHCPKCDNRLDQQTDGSTLTVDIAHHGERVHEALDKLDLVLADALAGVSAKIHLIVGGGLIKEAVLARLADEVRRGTVKRYAEQPGNAGAVLVQIR